MRNGNHTIYLNANSYIELPVVTVTGAPVTQLFLEDNSGISESEIPQRYSLSQNYPNPFNPSTMIEYTVAKTDKVELKVYDLLGREVATLVNEIQSPGSYNVTFNASNLSSGVYFYRLVSGNYTAIRKMMLVR